MVSYVPQTREEQMVRICLYVYVCVALPMIVGAWSMAVMLHDYYCRTESVSNVGVVVLKRTCEKRKRERLIPSGATLLNNYSGDDLAEVSDIP